MAAVSRPLASGEELRSELATRLRSAPRDRSCVMRRGDSQRFRSQNELESGCGNTMDLPSTALFHLRSGIPLGAAVFRRGFPFSEEPGLHNPDADTGIHHTCRNRSTRISVSPFPALLRATPDCPRAVIRR